LLTNIGIIKYDLLIIIIYNFEKSLISCPQQYLSPKMLCNIFWMLNAILPKGTVKDESTFFILVSILLGLIATAYIMRWRRNKETQ
ncbi:MAG: hypothetical protein WCD19_05830, partial [Nitrososphaeraceae archaeon]